MLLLLLPSRSVVSDSVQRQSSSPPGSPVPGILQARTLEWGAIAFSSASRESEVAQSCLTPSDPVDCSPPGSSIHGVF